MESQKDVKFGDEVERKEVIDDISRIYQMIKDMFDYREENGTINI
jgi:hypothetical protein